MIHLSNYLTSGNMIIEKNMHRGSISVSFKLVLITKSVITMSFFYKLLYVCYMFNVL